MRGSWCTGKSGRQVSARSCTRYGNHRFKIWLRGLARASHEVGPRLIHMTVTVQALCPNMGVPCVLPRKSVSGGAYNDSSHVQYAGSAADRIGQNPRCCRCDVQLYPLVPEGVCPAVTHIQVPLTANCGCLVYINPKYLEQLPSPTLCLAPFRPVATVDQYSICPAWLGMNDACCWRTWTPHSCTQHTVRDAELWATQGKVVFVAPTKPLVSQQIQACSQCMGIPKVSSPLPCAGLLL